MTEITILNGGKKFTYNTNEKISDILTLLMEHKFTFINLTDGGVLVLDSGTPFILREV